MNPDRVLTVNEYYDGPRLGVAQPNGVPYIYEAEFDHSTDEYGDTYFLSPIVQVFGRRQSRDTPLAQRAGVQKPAQILPTTFQYRLC